MANAENAKLQYEGAPTAYPMSALTNSGDATIFTSSATLFSKKTGYAPDVRPNGLITGGAIVPAVSGTDNLVDGAALTCYLAGVKTSVAADTDLSCGRAATDVSKINSITITNAGAYAVVAGVDGTTAALSETRGAAGGPPFIPVGSIEVAQVRYTGNTAAAVTSAEIFTYGYQERYDSPIGQVNYDTGTVVFSSALPLIHTGSVPKQVYASYASPNFEDVNFASDFVPVETSHSVSSTQVYGDTIASSSSSLGQGSFTAYLNDGLGDALVAQKNQTLWFRFYPDRYKTPHILTQGKLGIARTFPIGDTVQAACTISAERASIEVNA